MTSLYYSITLRQWKKGRLTEEQVNSYVPRLLTAEEAVEIIAIPQE